MVDVPCDPRAIDIEFAATVSTGGTRCPVTTNNLGGLGPGTGPQEMRYRAVGSVDHRKIDLVVRATTWYEGRTRANGCDGQFGTLGVYEGTGTDFEFQFQDSSTNEPVVLPHYYFTFFDFDHGGGKEILTAYDFSEFTMESDPLVDITDAEYVGNSTKLIATWQSVIRGGARNNPKDPTQLTLEQKRMSVTLAYVNTSTFKVHFEASARSSTTRYRGNRRLLFASKSSLIRPCPPSPPAIPSPPSLPPPASPPPPSPPPP